MSSNHRHRTSPLSIRTVREVDATNLKTKSVYLLAFLIVLPSNANPLSYKTNVYNYSYLTLFSGARIVLDLIGDITETDEDFNVIVSFAVEGVFERPSTVSVSLVPAGKQL